jgi:hypothetical protein
MIHSCIVMGDAEVALAAALRERLLELRHQHDPEWAATEKWVGELSKDEMSMLDDRAFVLFLREGGRASAPKPGRLSHSHRSGKGGHRVIQNNETPGSDVSRAGRPNGRAPFADRSISTDEPRVNLADVLAVGETDDDEERRPLAPRWVAVCECKPNRDGRSEV